MDGCLAPLLDLGLVDGSIQVGLDMVRQLYWYIVQASTHVVDDLGGRPRLVRSHPRENGDIGSLSD